MAAAGPEQLWLDVARPIQPRPPRERRAADRRAGTGEPTPDRQMEFAMTGPPRGQATVARAAEKAVAPSPPPPPVDNAPNAQAQPCFVTWLLTQSKSGGTIGELAKAARADRLFPRKGSADAVRARFGAAGADGDAYAALDDAERAYDRAA